MGTHGTSRDRGSGARDLFEKALFVKAGIEECAQAMTAAGMPQFPQGFRFDLADTLAGYGKMLADFFERMLAAVLQAKAHLDDLFLARTERLQHLGGLLAQVEVDDGLGRRDHPPVDDEIPQMRFFFFAYRRLERDRLLRDAQHLANFSDRQLHLDR